jgi:hypothetical protein
LPFTVFTDDRGRVVTAHLGELHDSEAALILDTVLALNEHHLSLEQAQERIAAEMRRLKPATQG